MLAKVLTGAVVGLDGALVEVEVDIVPRGLPNFLIVGLPDTAVQEARERVRAAIRKSGLAFPKRRRYLCCTLRRRSEYPPDARWISRRS
jgi:magnesium chelatase family protein